MTSIPTLVRPPRSAELVPPFRTIGPALTRRAADAAGALFLARAAAAGPFTPADRDGLADAVIGIGAVGAGQPVRRPLRPAGQLHLMVDGWACRAQTLASGACQITDLLLPGDMFGWASTDADGEGEDVVALEPARVAVLRMDMVVRRDLAGLQRGWRWARDAEARRLRARLVSLGRRNAGERVAHFMLETYQRLADVGLADDGTFTCPLTQQQLGDVLGLTTVHVNRVVQRLRGEGLLAFSRRRVFIPDLAALHATALLEAGPQT